MDIAREFKVDKVCCVEMQHTDSPIRPVNPPDIAPTLQARMGTGGNNVPLVYARGCNRKA